MRRVPIATLAAAVIALAVLIGEDGARAGSHRASSASACSAHGGLPDRSCTPGARDPRVTQGNIGVTICRKGYTTTVRPPTSYTEPLKLKQMRQYGYYAGRQPSAYEEDHLISLELGGSPTSPKNLWPEAHYPKPGSYQKDAEENALHRRVCDGQEALRPAQHEIAADWLHAYRRDH